MTFELGNSSDVRYRLSSPFLLIIRPLRSARVGVTQKIVHNFFCEARCEIQINLEWKSCQQLLFLLSDGDGEKEKGIKLRATT